MRGVDEKSGNTSRRNFSLPARLYVRGIFCKENKNIKGAMMVKIKVDTFSEFMAHWVDNTGYLRMFINPIAEPKEGDITHYVVLSKDNVGDAMERVAGQIGADDKITAAKDVGNG